MHFELYLNARFQPKHRFELEDALQEIFEENKAGEITGGGTSLKENSEIGRCDIDIDFSDAQKSLEWLVNLLNTIGIPKGSVLRGIEPPINVRTLEGLAIYMNGTDLAEEIFSFQPFSQSAFHQNAFLLSIQSINVIHCLLQILIFSPVHNRTLSLKMLFQQVKSSLSPIRITDL